MIWFILTTYHYMSDTYSGLSSLGVPGVPWQTQYFADQLTLFQPGGTDYAHLITTGIPRFSDLRTALILGIIFQFYRQFSICNWGNNYVGNQKLSNLAIKYLCT